MTDTFVATPLITAERLAANPSQAISITPPIVPQSEGVSPYETAVIAELNRFPGSPIIAYVPEGKNRETVLKQVEKRARTYEAENPTRIAIRAYGTIATFLDNLRQLFTVVDIDRHERAVDPITTFREAIPAMVESFKDPRHCARHA